RFCLLLMPDAAHGSPARVCFEGLLGMLLTLAQEYQSVTCRALRLGAGVDAAEAALSALCSAGPVERVHRDGGVFTPGFAPSPAPPVSDPAIRPGDVLLISGGAKGVTARLAAELAPLGPRLVLLGRSPEGDEERAVLENLRGLGAEAEYAVCDVADRAAVRSVVRAVVARHGRVDGVVHGAGVLRDGFLAMMPREDFAAVAAVKLGGLRNLLEAAGPGLRVAAAFSSVAAWQGNVGQTNYCCANRAMASLLLGLGPGVAARAFWLPPVSGVGMASGEEIRELMRLKGMSRAYVDVDELAPVFCRELLAATPGGASVLLARHMPTTDTVVRPEAPRDAASSGALLPVEGLPMLDEVRLDGLSPLSATAARRVSRERDLWLPDHRPYQQLRDPLFSAVMVAETFCEAARALQPHLTPVGLDELRFLDILPCPAGWTRELRAHVSRRPAEGPETALDALLESRDMSPKGRPLDRWTAHFRGRVLLAGRPAALKPWPDFPPDGADTAGPVSGPEMEAVYAAHTGQTGRYRVLAGIDGAGPGHVSGSMVYRLGEDVRGFTGAFQYSPYLLEALMQLTLMHGLLVRPGEAGAQLPAGIGSVRFGRACRDGEEITLLARLRGKDVDGCVWDALGQAGDGEILMQVRDLSMKRLRG
ncbi:SDR family NAD(P)-dependent oxidoreductase, partial [Desulfovibrio sp.]